MTEPVLPLGDPGETPGPDHRAVTPTAPNKAFWRTLVQVFIPASIALVGILPEVLQEIVNGFGQELPPSIYGVLVTVTAALSLVAAIAAKIMANVKVLAWTRQYVPFLFPQKVTSETP